MTGFFAVRYAFQEVEKRWQDLWQEKSAFAASELSSKEPAYVLEMFPYPSGKPHMGHARNYAIGDAVARHLRAKGLEVLHPMGWDAFGLPAENAALAFKVHPKAWTYDNAAEMRTALQSLGFSYDWNREIFSCDPLYYGHQQRIFLSFYKAGIAYRKNSFVNWDPVEHTVLANEQVIEGKGWRSGALVERRSMTQWFLKVTAFANDLLVALFELEKWPEAVRTMQDKWIGRSEGATLMFPLKGDPEVQFEVFSTRPETIFGASFLALSPDHPFFKERSFKGFDAFYAKVQQGGTSTQDREKAPKLAFHTGLFVTNPLNGRELPLIAASYVLSEYGTGAVFGCPAHDVRDYEMALQENFPIHKVILNPELEQADQSPDGPYTGTKGIMIASDFLNGMPVMAAREQVITTLQERKMGRKSVNYSLRDWGVSRQRYWGCPIPIIHCEKCGVVPVPEEDLPVVLPQDVTFDRPGNPLDRHPTWKHTTCPQCGQAAVRETDTLDTFFDSSWYFLRFCSPHDTKQPFCPKAVRRWLPVREYIGGIEHAVLHLLYSRFFMRALREAGYEVPVVEPFDRLFAQGMVCHKTYQETGTRRWLYPTEVTLDAQGTALSQDGTKVLVGRSEKMSKSKANVVPVDAMVRAYGADAVRLFLLSDSPPERNMEWTDEGIEGCWRYIQRLWKLFHGHRLLLVKGGMEGDELTAPQKKLRHQVHKSLQEINREFENYHFNKVIALIRTLTNELEAFPLEGGQDGPILWEAWNILISLIGPFMPHLAEEMNHLLGHEDFLHLRGWPEVDPEALAQEEVLMVLQINGKTKGTFSLPGLCEEERIAQIVRAHPLIRDLGHPIKKMIIVPGKIVNVVV